MVVSRAESEGCNHTRQKKCLEAKKVVIVLAKAYGNKFYRHSYQVKLISRGVQRVKYKSYSQPLMRPSKLLVEKLLVFPEYTKVTQNHQVTYNLFTSIPASESIVLFFHRQICTAPKHIGYRRIFL